MIPVIKWRRCWLLFLLLALVLSGCQGAEETGQPVEPGQTPAVIVSTVEPSRPAPTARPTEVPPTATPTFTPTPPAPLAAVVNGQYIFLADYERQVAQLEQAMLAQGLDPGTEEGQAQLAEKRREVLESLIDYLLIEQGQPAWA